MKIEQSHNSAIIGLIIMLFIAVIGLSGQYYGPFDSSPSGFAGSQAVYVSSCSVASQCAEQAEVPREYCTDDGGCYVSTHLVCTERELVQVC